MKFNSRKYLPAVLILLIVIDASLAAIGFFFPGIWFGLQHGDSKYVDTQGLLLHSAFFWASYVVLQFIGFFSWRKNKSWINIFITIRIVDIFLIGAYIYSDPLLLPSAKVILCGVLPANLFVAWFFWKCRQQRRLGDAAFWP